MSSSSGQRCEALRLLGLEGPVERLEVVSAYRRLVREHHPDLGGDPEVFRVLTLARDLLLADWDGASEHAGSLDGRSVRVRQRPSRRVLRRLRRRLGRRGGGRRHLE